MSEVDVIVAGGGVAGAAVAAALAAFGYKVTVVEPGLDASKRLAGELIHPPGATALAELGLLSHLEQAGGVPVSGFAILPHAADPACLLPYAEKAGLMNQGLAMEHGTIRERLLGALESLPHVSVHHGARIVSVDLHDPNSVRVTTLRNGKESQMRAKILVAADGGSSLVSKLAGISQRRTRISTMVGYLVENAELPHPGYGHVFLDGPAPILAYAIAPGKVRLLFDVPDSSDGLKAIHREPRFVNAVPEPLRRALRSAMNEQAGLVSASYTVIPDRVVQDRVVLVGDAGGCCHPLTATGLSVCTRDALRLRDALRESGGDIPRALLIYRLRRKGPQRTRLTLASALYEAFRGQTPEMRLVRGGLLRYWSRNPEGCAASMTLLTMSEDRISVMAQQYALAILHGMSAQIPVGREGHPKESARQLRQAAMQVSTRILHFARAALQR